MLFSFSSNIANAVAPCARPIQLEPALAGYACPIINKFVAEFVRVYASVNRVLAISFTRLPIGWQPRASRARIPSTFLSYFLGSFFRK
jgi:hypothetical protein